MSALMMTFVNPYGTCIRHARQLCGQAFLRVGRPVVVGLEAQNETMTFTTDFP